MNVVYTITVLLGWWGVNLVSLIEEVQNEHNLSKTCCKYCHVSVHLTLTLIRSQ